MKSKTGFLKIQSIFNCLFTPPFFSISQARIPEKSDPIY